MGVSAPQYNSACLGISLFDITGYPRAFFDFKDLVCAFGRESGLSGQTKETYYFSKLIRLHFASFQSGWWWQQKWGSPEALGLRDKYPEDVTGCGRHKRRVLLARQTRLGSGAGEVWGAVQLLKEQQAAFQLLTRAAASDGNESCEHKQALPSLEYDRFFFSLSNLLFVDNLRQHQTEIRPAASSWTQDDVSF